MKTRQFIHFDLIKPEYSTKVFKAYFFYFRDHNNEKIVHDICREIGVPPEYILEDGNWVSNEFERKFINLLIQRTGIENIAERVAIYNIHPDSINIFEYSLIKAMPFHLFLWLVPFQTKKLNRYSSFGLKKLRYNNATYTLTPNNPSSPHDRAICQNTIGTLRSFNRFFKLKSLEVTETRCIHKNAKHCEFEVEFTRSTSRRTLAVLAGLAFLIFFLRKASDLFAHSDFETSKNLFFILGLIAIGSSLIAAFTFYRIVGVIKHQVLTIEQDRIRNRELHENHIKLDRRYRESNLLRELSLQLNITPDPNEVIDICLRSLSNKFGYSRSLVMLIDRETSTLKTVNQRGFDKNASIVRDLSFQYPGRKENPFIFANILSSGKTVLIENIEQFKTQLLPANQKLIDFLEVTSLVVAPIQDDQVKYGLLTIGSIGGERSVTDEDRHLIENVVRMLSLFFKNAQSFRKEQILRSIFEKYVPDIVLKEIGNKEDDKFAFIAPRISQITSFFIDLRGFTALSEKLDVHKTFDLLNRFLKFGSDIIAKHGGIIDKLIGDGIVAFFLENRDSKSNHAQRAFDCAIDFLTNIPSLNHELEQIGLPTLNFGIGINSGSAIIGSLGSDVRLNYTAIGDVVNTAARLQEASKKFHDVNETRGYVIISESTYLLLNEGQNICSSHGEIVIRGKTHLCKVYAIDQKQLVEKRKIPA